MIPGLATPALDNWPQIFEDLDWAYDGWWYMHPRRPVDNGGVRLLSERQMLDYCEIAGLDQDDRWEALNHYWPAMDSVYLSYIKRKSPTGIGGGGGEKKFQNNPEMNHPRPRMKSNPRRTIGDNR